MESRFSGSSILPFNIIIAKWGEDRRIAIPPNTSSKNTLRSPSGATGEFLLRPENGDFAWDFLGTNSPVPFEATGEGRSRGTSSQNDVLSHFNQLETGDFAQTKQLKPFQSCHGYCRRVSPNSATAIAGGGHLVRVGVLGKVPVRTF